MKAKSNRFSAKIANIGVNPYVLVPPAVRSALFAAAGRKRGPLAVKGTLDGHAFRQNLVRYKGRWRLYLNTPMRKAAGKGVGDTASFELAFDASPPREKMHPKLARALGEANLKSAFDALAPSRRKEILRYLNRLKSTAALERALTSVLAHLAGSATTTTPSFLRVGGRVS